MIFLELVKTHRAYHSHLGLDMLFENRLRRKKTLTILMVLGFSGVESMRFKLLKSVSDIFIAFLVVVIHFGVNLKYDANPNNAVLPQMKLYKWLGWPNDYD